MRCQPEVPDDGRPKLAIELDGTVADQRFAVIAATHEVHVLFGLHNVVRAGIKQSALFREVALKMDDFFYGRTPTPAADQPWLNPAVE